MNTFSNLASFSSNDMSFETTHLGNATALTQLTESVSPSNTFESSVERALSKEPSQDKVVWLIEELENRRLSWEQGVYRTSNVQLYHLLAECLAFVLAYDVKGLNTARRKGLEMFCVARKYRFKNDTPLANKIVRAVFGEIGRSRISTYSLVVRQAQSRNIKPADMVAWIESEGGIQEIKVSKSATHVSPADKAQIAMQHVAKSNDLGTIKTEMLSQLASPDHINSDCVLIATQLADGSYSLRAMVRSKAVVDAAFEAFYKANKSLINQEAAERNAQQLAA